MSHEPSFQLRPGTSASLPSAFHKMGTGVALIWWCYEAPALACNFFYRQCNHAEVLPAAMLTSEQAVAL